MTITIGIDPGATGAIAAKEYLVKGVAKMLKVIERGKCHT